MENKMKADKLLQTFNLFRKLNISSILPEVSQGEFCVLKTIWTCNEGNSPENMKVSELAEKLELAPPSVSRTLNGLENRGLVKKIPDSGDRRNTHVELTREGMELVKQADDIIQEFVESVASQMGEEELEKLNEYFVKLYCISKQELELRKINSRRNN